MPVLEMDAISREKTLLSLSDALLGHLRRHTSGLPRQDLFTRVIAEHRCYEGDLVLALARLDVLEADDGTVSLAG